jgi:hypothetical protein
VALFSARFPEAFDGDMVSAGQFLKYSPWENYGTTLGIRSGNQPEMLTTRLMVNQNGNSIGFL